MGWADLRCLSVFIEVNTHFYHVECKIEMPKDFFANCGASDLNGYTGNALNRLGEQRSSLDLPALHADERARYYLLSEARQLVKSINPYNALFTNEEVRGLGSNPDEAYLLGLTKDGAPVFAYSVPRAEEYPFGAEAVDLRNITRSGLLNDEEIGATAQARSLVLWHNSNQYCPRNGTKTVVDNAGYSRRCPIHGTTYFPRTDPVVIMLAIDGENCLLGRSPSFPEHMLSCLAGFVEVGETIEDAVRRETFEEAGVKTGRVAYHSCQPWPFPSSLMIGCMAEATSTEIVTDDELEFCGWFSRMETRQILERSHPKGLWSPPQMAIAHQLMRAFAYD